MHTVGTAEIYAFRGVMHLEDSHMIWSKNDLIGYFCR